MSVNYHEMCCGSVGRAIEINCHDGAVHRGVIERVEHDGVWLSPIPPAGGAGAPEGPGMYAWGWGWGWWWVPFAAVATLAFLPWLFW